MSNYLTDYFRCPETYAGVAQSGKLEQGEGFFRFGSAICYGQAAGLSTAKSPSEPLADARLNTTTHGGTTYLPFDLTRVVDNLRNESYVRDSHFRTILGAIMAKGYYFVRPLLSVVVRKHIQRVRLTHWDKIPFPRWPIDTSVDNLLESLLLMALRSQGLERIPFIWFWPDGTDSCAVMTHDIETTEGRDFCSHLMDINDRYGIKSSFQVVPERRYEVPDSCLQEMRDRGFEINVQDLNHDGHLYRDKEQFLERVAKINSYGKQWGANGFRSAILYRQQKWFDSFDFSYDMSVPNVAHLDPQRGGCCTVMPYFVGDMLELPVTTIQDYSLFHILNDYSLTVWKKQSALIMQKHGLMNFIIHPDYILSDRPRRTYEELLGYLVELRDESGVWLPTPGEVNQWWRQRAAMKLIGEDGEWRVEGEGHERARVAYASEHDGKLVLNVGSAAVEPAHDKRK